MMFLTYLFHSGYLIEAKTCVLLFDYFQDTQGNDNGILHDFLSECKKPVYIFVTHFHADHYNPVILTWKEKYKQIVFHYIFSNDIRRRRGVSQNEALFLRRGEEYKDDLLYVKAYGSTDAGVSFYIGLERMQLFHAGDLNNWHWKDESTPEEIIQSERAYERELDFIAQDQPAFDVVMFPVDPRLGSDYSKGALQFVERFHPKVFCPMHFGMAYYVCKEFSKIVPNDCKVIEWTDKGQQIRI